MNNYEDAFSDDYKLAWLEDERLRQERSVDGWIYVGTHDGDQWERPKTKVGLTTKRLGTRASSSHNPFYVVVCAFKVREGVSGSRILEIETAVIGMLQQCYERIPHRMTGKLSEWFYADPREVMETVDRFLGDRFGMDMHGYYDPDRDHQVIHKWENEFYLKGTPNRPYRARDTSDPLVPFECYMPGGCENCDCQLWGNQYL